MQKNEESFNKSIKRLGETTVNRYGSKITIIEYNAYNDITVKFDNGFIKKSSYKEFSTGAIKSPYCKTKYNYGFLGIGDYTPTKKINEKNIITNQYRCWADCLGRCYDDKWHKKKPTYKECKVYEEWHNFQVFAKWFDENYYEIDGEVMQLDKDILIKGNKIYSPDTCVFVPNRINCLFTKSDKARGKYPIGVTKNGNRFVARVNTTNGRVEVGKFKTPEEAFYKYKEFKENYIKQVADEYKDKIPKKLYDAMYRYEVEIDD